MAVVAELRNAPRRMLADGATQRPALPLELSYMITPWAKQASHANLLAGMIVQVFHEHAELATAELAGDGWGPTDTVQLALESLPIDDHYRIWDTTKLPYHLSMTYSARVLGIDPLSRVRAPRVAEAALSAQAR